MSVSIVSLIEREQRRAKWRRRIVRALFGPDYDLIHRGDLGNLRDYVTLTNSLLGIGHRAARLVDNAREGGRVADVVLLAEQVDAFRRAYPNGPDL